MSMKDILEKLYSRTLLSEKDAYDAMQTLISGSVNAVQTGAFMSYFNARKPSVQEIQGFRNALLDNSNGFEIDVPSIDLCGTGGDHKNTFNISTLTAIVVAAAGYYVSKHGNYSASSVSGSSNILEYFGYVFSVDESKNKKQLEENHLCFLHAPLFHPSLKNIGPARKDLQVRTFFNVLGPLVNPVKPKFQMVGVYDLEVARLYEYTLQLEDEMKYTIVHNLEGYDEVVLRGKNKITQNAKEYILNFENLGLKHTSAEDIFGGNTMAENAKIFESVLKNTSTQAQKETVLINSALAIQTINNKELEVCLDEANASLESGKAYENFKKLIDLSKQ